MRLGHEQRRLGHDAHLHYSYMTLVCTSCCYAFIRMQFARVATVEHPKTDSPYYGNLHNMDKWPQSQIIPYSLVYIATSLLQIIDTEVTPQWTKSLQISL